jgi:hypothetical protein
MPRPFIKPNGLWHTWAGAADDPQTRQDRIAVHYTALARAAHLSKGRG